MRGALFNTLGDIEGLNVIDPFGGTGAISFEAISRGAAASTVIEQDKRAYNNIQDSVRILGVDKQIKTIRANASGWSDNSLQKKVELLLMDPPYDNLQISLMQKLIDRHLKNGGVAVMSFPGRVIVTPPYVGTEILTTKKYGDGQLAFYRKVS